jgi:hypothetical protein
MTVQYDPSTLNFARTLRKWRGTSLPLVMCQPVFWLFVVGHSALAFVAYHVDNGSGGSLADTFPDIGYSLVSSVMSLLVFFLVFYGSQCYNRLQMFYAQCVGIGGSSMNWVALVKTKLLDEPNTRWNAVRYMLAANHVLYYSLNADSNPQPPRKSASDYPQLPRKSDLSDEEWNIITSRGLLSQREKEIVDAHDGGPKFFLLILWAMQEVEEAVARRATRTPYVYGRPTDSLAHLAHLPRRTPYGRAHRLAQCTHLLRRPVLSARSPGTRIACAALTRRLHRICAALTTLAPRVGCAGTSPWIRPTPSSSPPSASRPSPSAATAARSPTGSCNPSPSRNSTPHCHNSFSSPC